MTVDRLYDVGSVVIRLARGFRMTEVLQERGTDEDAEFQGDR